MRRLASVLLVAAMGFAGCTAKTPKPAEETTRPAPSPTQTVTEPLTLESLILAPGAVGPVTIGMSEDEAMETGLFEPIDMADYELCPPPAQIQWKPDFEGLDVFAHEGTILSLGVFSPGPHTVEGIAVGSTMAQVREVYGDVTEVSLGYDQTGIQIQDGDKWIGFLFDEPIGSTTSDSLVRFIEVTTGDKPALIRDGC